MRKCMFSTFVYRNKQAAAKTRGTIWYATDYTPGWCDCSR